MLHTVQAKRASRLICIVALQMLGATAGAAPSTDLSPLADSALSRIRPYVMDNSRQFTLRAADGRRFEISVALPKAPPPPHGYPVLYVLDPNHSFATLAELVRNHEPMWGPVVVVGVGYPSDEEIRNRIFDMTPPSTEAAKLPALFPQGWGPVGGGANFYDFLVHDVRNGIKAIVPLDLSRQALFGHSLGGLFVLDVLLAHPESFDTYIAGSPSIWWSDKVVLKELATFELRLRQCVTGRRVLIAAGALEDRTNPEELRHIQRFKLENAAEMPRIANMLGNSRSLAAQLQAIPHASLEVSYVVFPDETHNSVIPAYLARGARFTLAHWKP